MTGDLRRDLFRHLTGHSQHYFAERLPGTLTSRVTATSNAVFTGENMFVWNVLPPCAATVAAIALVATVSVTMACGLAVVAGIMVCLMFRFAAAGRPLHHDFAGKAALVDGEMADVVSNMPLVLAFGGLRREHQRFDATVERKWTRAGAAFSTSRSSGFFTRRHHHSRARAARLGIMSGNATRPPPASRALCTSAFRCCMRRAMYCAGPQRLAELVPRRVSVGNQLVDTLLLEKLARQGSPRDAGRVPGDKRSGN